jgi:hypothetical protein
MWLEFSQQTSKPFILSFEVLVLGGLKRLGRAANHPPTSSAGVKKE